MNETSWKEREIQKCIDIITMEGLREENRKSIKAYLESLVKDKEGFEYW